MPLASVATQKFALGQATESRAPRASTQRASTSPARKRCEESETVSVKTPVVADWVSEETAIAALCVDRCGVVDRIRVIDHYAALRPGHQRDVGGLGQRVISHRPDGHRVCRYDPVPWLGRLDGGRCGDSRGRAVRRSHGDARGRPGEEVLHCHCEVRSVGAAARATAAGPTSEGGWRCW